MHGPAARTVSEAAHAAGFERGLRLRVGFEVEPVAGDDGDEESISIEAVAAEHAA